MTKDSFNFTKEILLKIEAPKVQREIYKDTKEAGLILIVSYGGSKVFYLAKRIKPKYYRIKIGAFPDISVADARAKASELKTQIGKGINPTEKQTVDSDTEMTFKQLFDKYINDYAKYNIKKWQDCIASMDRQGKHFYEIKISLIQKADVQKTFNDLTLNGKYTANRFLEMLRAIFNKAIEWELLEKNPTNGIKKHKEKARDRYITSEEKSRFFQAVEEEKNQVMKDFILISLYTAARKSNVLSMHWRNINLGDQTWYIPDTKNGEPQLVPLTKKAMLILQRRLEQSNSEWVFPSNNSASGHLQEPKKAWKRICNKAELKNLRIHDLRRTAGSWMAISGASQYVIGKALNHKSPESTAIYARLSIDPVREFMEKADCVFDKIQ